MMTSKSYRSWAGAAVVAAVGAVTALALPVSASAVQIPADAGNALTADSDADVTQVRARGGGGGHFHGGGGHHRGGGHYRGGRYVPWIVGPAIGYGAYSYYYSDCRVVRVKEHRCWRDEDGDRRCGTRWVARRVCD